MVSKKRRRRQLARAAAERRAQRRAARSARRRLLERVLATVVAVLLLAGLAYWIATHRQDLDTAPSAAARGAEYPADYIVASATTSIPEVTR